ncbi:MAG: GAF domain-containing protein [Bacteroidales bacterium]|nr:GAF domain-containing protein [Bacteroidales bacterium]
MDVNKKYNNKNTLRWKTVVSTITVAVLLSAVILFIQDRLMFTRITDHSKLQTNIRNDRYTVAMEQQLTNTIIKLQTMAESISEQTGQEGIPAKEITQKMMLRFLNGDQSAKSIFIISEPYIFDNSDSLLVNTNPGFPIGWYSKYIRHESMGTPEVSNDLQSSSSDIYDMYRVIKHDNTPKVVSRSANADISNVIVCMMPIYTKNKFSGVIGTDIDQKYYRNMLDNQIPASSTIYIADSTGNIFYSRNKDYLNRNVHEILRFTEEKLGIMAKTAENLPVDAVCELVENNGEKVYIHSKRIPLACNDDNFTMISINSLAEIKTDQNHTLIRMIIMVALLLLLLAVFLFFISRRIIRPFDNVKRLIDHINAGEYALDKYLPSTLRMPQEWLYIVDSIRTLASSLKNTSDFANKLKDKHFEANYEKSITDNPIGSALVTLRNDMLETSEKEQQRFNEERQNQWATEGHSIFSDILRNNISDIHKLCDAVMDRLVPYINVTQGGIFIRTTRPDDPNTECFELYAVFAFGHHRFHKRILALDEGIIGACAMEKHTIIINEVPDNYTEIGSGLGQAKPKALMFVPLLYNDYLYGVMEFAAFVKFEQYQIDFVERISENIASTIANAKINEQTNMLLQQSRQQSKLMEEKEDQLKTEIESLNNLVHATQSELNQIEQVNNALNKTMLVAIFSAKGDTIEANRRFALRYTLDVNDIRRKNVYEILQLTLSKYDEFKKIWDNVKQGTTETYTIEFKINKDVRKIKNTFIPIYDTDSNVNRILCLAADITGQQNTEDELVKTKNVNKELTAELTTLKKTLQSKDMEIATINSELVETKQSNADTRQKMDKANQSAQFYKKELEKRITKSRKIENTLKEKVKNKDEEIARLQRIINGEDQDDAAEQSDGGETPKDTL